MEAKAVNTVVRKRIGAMGDATFKAVTIVCASLILAAVIGIFFELFEKSIPALKMFGAGFVVSKTWDPVSHEYGALSSIYGTLVSTLIAMAIAMPLSVVVALFLVELAPPRLSKIVGASIELLAAVPSVIFGMWGLFVFAPFMADHVQPAIQNVAGSLPLFQGPPMGIGMLTAGIILALMVLPFASAVIRDVFEMVPPVVKESAYGLGATTWETTRRVTMRYGFKGIVGAGFLALGRALGETMAITFVIGNDHGMSKSLFAAGNSIASTLANEFTEASEQMYLSALVELGLVLFVISLIAQVAAHFWLKSVAAGSGMSR